MGSHFLNQGVATFCGLLLANERGGSHFLDYQVGGVATFCNSGGSHFYMFVKIKKKNY